MLPLLSRASGERRRLQPQRGTSLTARPAESQRCGDCLQSTAGSRVLTDSQWLPVGLLRPFQAFTTQDSESRPLGMDIF